MDTIRHIVRFGDVQHDRGGCAVVKWYIVAPSTIITGINSVPDSLPTLVALNQYQLDHFASKILETILMKLLFSQALHFVCNATQDILA